MFHHSIRNIGRLVWTAAVVLAICGYFVALHLAISRGGAASSWALALIVAPWIACLVARCPAHWRLAVASTAVVAAAMLVWFFGPALASRAQTIVFIENLAFHLGLATLFGTSLLPGRIALVTRFAQGSPDTHLANAVVAYTRRVTLAWTLFFIAVASLSAILYATSRAAWSLFVNLLVWPAIALMFVSEFAIRTRVLSGMPYHGLLESVGVWRSYRAPRAVRRPGAR